MSIIFKEATNKDISQIFNLQRVAWLATYPNKEYNIKLSDIKSKFLNLSNKEWEDKKARYRSRISDPNIFFLLAKEGGKVVGYCQAIKNHSEHRIGAIYVSPDRQRQGVGSRMFEKALDWLGSSQPIFLNVASYNQQAINFYQKFSFYLTGKIVEDPAGVLPTGTIIPEIEMKRD